MCYLYFGGTNAIVPTYSCVNKRRQRVARRYRSDSIRGVLSVPLACFLCLRHGWEIFGNQSPVMVILMARKIGLAMRTYSYTARSLSLQTTKITRSSWHLSVIIRIENLRKTCLAPYLRITESPDLVQSDMSRIFNWITVYSCRNGRKRLMERIVIRDTPL